MDLAADLADLLTRAGVPGAVVGSVESDGSTDIVVAGERGGGRGRVDEETVFEAASLTKPVFACAVMALVHAGVLDLERPLADYGVAHDVLDDDRADAITARMVLSHTTGFPNWREDEPLRVRWAPGSRWGYAGEGFAYLHRVVEHITGASLEGLLRETVFGPLRMHRSTAVWREALDTRIAVGHDHRGNSCRANRGRAWKAAAGGLYTTGPDYLRFLAHALRHHSSMFEPQVQIDDELAWGLGWGIEDGDGGRCVWQWGNNPGYKNIVIGRPSDGRGVVVFTNGDRGTRVYGDIVHRILPGQHPSLETRRRPRWRLAVAPRPVVLGGGRGTSASHELGLVVQRSWELPDVAPGTPIARIALEPNGNAASFTITALTVLPEWRGQGFGSTLLFGACELLGARAAEAEVEGDVVEFFRASGFTAEPIGGRRFRCRLELDSP